MAAADPIIEIEDRASDTDSLSGSVTDASYTTSVTSSIKNYVYENGRRYHAFKEGEYLLPNDEDEQERMDISHHTYRLLLDGNLHKAPIPKDVQRVLDLGTGTGIWAMEFADEYPSAQVIGNDLSPIQPAWVPPNCKFEVDDFEADWPYTQPFDYIHAREMDGMIKDHDRFFKQAYTHLKPNGWFEIQTLEADFFSDDGSHLKATDYARWKNLLHEAAEKFGKPMNTVPTWAKRVEEAGFKNVTDEILKVPCGPWPKDKKLKEMGKFHQLQMYGAFTGYTIAPLSRVLGWSNEEIEVLIAGLRNQIQDKSIHVYARAHFIYGQKPADGA
ncbi:hypothetical protein FQN50_000177 [Emmonsiellopsis sp. PD_5]|nr:hypothetical protein FQN50_000177 [Emmonsiellopsis sp. PD_5]